MSKGDVYKEWEKGILRIDIRASRTYDADIVQAISRAVAQGEGKSAAAMRLMRQGIKAEKEGWV